MASNPNNDLMMQMAMAGMYGPNRFSPYPDQPMPIPGYADYPTDAYGQPIALPPGMTLNQPAPQQAAPQQSATPSLISIGQNNPQVGQLMGWQAFTNPEKYAAGDVTGSSSLNYGLASSLGGVNALKSQAWPRFNAASSAATGAGTPAATAAPQPATNASGLTRDQYLQLLANPGPVTMPGATVPQSPALSQQPSVLNQFLAQNKGGTGAGNYSNQGFFNTLNALRGNPTQTG